MRIKENLIELLNLNYLHYSNKTVSKGSMDIPAICCNTEIYPDFIALYSEKGLYHKTDRTAVGFFSMMMVLTAKMGCGGQSTTMMKKGLHTLKNVSKV